MKGLTPRQHEILTYIKEYIASKGYPPSYRELMHYFGISSLGPVAKHITALKRKGYLLPEIKGQRSLIPVEIDLFPISQDVMLPFIGYLTGKGSIETFAKIQQFAISSSLVSSPEQTYVLQAKGDDLNEELIASGDFLIIEARQEANAGETVVGMINQEDIIVKKIFPEEGDFIRLTGHNPHLTSIILRRGDLKVQGIILHVIRFLRPETF
jgi:repressor LexA